MPKLWLTYAWKDNEDADVDFVIQSLEKRGIDVRFDRVQLQAGKRLWDKIDKGITDASQSDAWAIFLTQNSLSSEPCQEELAYALDRALRIRDAFPLIGIFPHTIDRQLVPSAIATRLWVQLKDPTWADQIAASLTGGTRAKPAIVEPYAIKHHQDTLGPILEIRPRDGRWYPAYLLVPEDEFGTLRLVAQGPSGALPGAAMTSIAESKGPVLLPNGSTTSMQGYRLDHDISNATSLYACFNGKLPSKVAFGTRERLFVFEP